ncbi:MAG: hypothetical protein WCB93_05620 [Gallionella sp.]
MLAGLLPHLARLRMQFKITLPFFRNHAGRVAIKFAGGCRGGGHRGTVQVGFIEWTANRSGTIVISKSGSMDWAIVWASILPNWLRLLQAFVASVQHCACPALILFCLISISAPQVI